MKKLRVGVIGAGSIGQHHARVYASMPDVDLVGIVDADKYRAQEIAEKCNTTAYTNYNKILTKVDAVSISSPTTTHFKIAQDFMRRGKHVLIEKPLTAKVAEATKLMKVAKSKKIIMQVGYIERFNPAYREAEKIAKASKIFSIETRRLSPFIPRAIDVSVVLDLLSHDIDLLYALTGSEVTSISAIGRAINSKTLNYISVQLQFEGGIVATCIASKISHHRVREMTINCEGRTIDVDFIAKGVAVHRHSVLNYLPGKATVAYKEEEDTYRVPIAPQQETLYLELQHFIDCIQTGKTPITSGEIALQTLKLAEQIEKQANRSLRG